MKETLEFISMSIAMVCAILAAYHGFNGDWPQCVGFLITSKIFNVK